MFPRLSLSKLKSYLLIINQWRFNLRVKMTVLLNLSGQIGFGKEGCNHVGYQDSEIKFFIDVNFENVGNGELMIDDPFDSIWLKMVTGK